MTVLLETRNVSKSYGEFRALDQVTMFVAVVISAQPDRDRIRFRHNNELLARDLRYIDGHLRVRDRCRDNG